MKPVLVLTGSNPTQQVAFHDRVPVGGRLRLFGGILVDTEAKIGRGREAIPKLAGLTPDELIASGATNYRRWVNFPWAVVERGGQAQAGAWTPEDAARLGMLTTRAHALGLWIRFYTLNGHAAADDGGWTASYNFGEPAAAETRWRAARDAGVDFIATDQYEGLARVLARPAAAQGAGAGAAVPAADAQARPGVQGGGITLLPNGWRIAPIGKHLQAGDFPLAMVAAPDRRHLIISNNGWSKPTLTIVDTEQWTIKAKVPVDHAWLGLAWDAGGKRLYSSGAAENTVQVFDYTPGALKVGTPIVLAEPAVRLPPGVTDMAGTGFVGGIAMSRDGKTLYAVHVFGRAFSAIDAATGIVRKTVPLPAEPYTVLPADDGRRVFVSLWGGAKVLALDATTLATVDEVEVGGHPNAMALAKDGKRLFVACANTNRVWVIDVDRFVAREQISVTPFPDAPPGTTPNALAVSPDGEMLFVANADNNNLALVDDRTRRSQRGRSASSRLAGIRPRCASIARASGSSCQRQGAHRRQANPQRPDQSISPPARPASTSAQLLQGHAVDDRRARAGRDAGAHRPRHGAARPTPTPSSSRRSARRPTTRFRPASATRRPIKHCIYIIKENRTYDQVFGDMPEGNGDPNLCLFREQVTPNHHTLAREFVLLDNFYVEGEVSPTATSGRWAPTPPTSSRRSGR